MNILPLSILTVAVAYTPIATASEVVDGAALVRENCAACHEAQSDGLSRNPAAPSLGVISQRYSLDQLAELMETGRFFERHPQMPNFRMNRDAARALVNHLRSLQDR